MNRWLAAIILTLILTAPALAAGKGPEIQLVDNKLSIDAEAVSLSRLLRLLDLATGMQSKVPPELANRNISVKFSGLNLSEGVRKMFQGQPLDYVMIEGQGIIVTAASQAISTSDAAPAYAAPTPPPIEQPFVENFAGPPPPQFPNQQQPAMIQTPFGPIANPRAGQPVAPNAPLSGPGQQPNSLFPSPFGQQQQQLPGQQMPMVQPGFPGAMPANPPFGGPSSFGGTTPQPQNNLFGPQPIFSNPAPLGAPGTQQRTP